MEKQELIEKWENKTSAPSCEISASSIRPSEHEMYTVGYGVARVEIIEDLKQLDKPQAEKVEVPDFVAEWIEQSKKERQSLYEAMYNIESSTYYHKYDNATYQWMFEGALHDEHQELFAEAYMHGYEVEQEPKFVLKHQNGMYFTRFNEKMEPLLGGEKRAYRFTDESKAEALTIFFNGTVEKVEVR